MQSTQASSKQSLNVHGPLSASKFQERRLNPSLRSSVSEEFMGVFQWSLKFPPLWSLKTPPPRLKKIPSFLPG